MVRLTISQLKALCYADVFNYPLTYEEVVKYQIKDTNDKHSKLLNHPLQTFFVVKDNYYMLSDREDCISKRKLKEAYSHEKIKRLEKFALYFKLIPTILLIAVTGAAAAGNATKDDDIDILVVARAGWLWTTRFLVVAVAELLGVRRRPGTKHTANTFCFNMFVDENHLNVPQNEQDVFSANELSRLKVVLNKNDTHTRLCNENAWVRSYLPKYHLPKKICTSPKGIDNGLNGIEWLAKTAQLRYMDKKRTTEVIRDGYVRFHPRDARSWIIKGYLKRLRRFGLE